MCTEVIHRCAWLYTLMVLTVDVIYARCLEVIITEQVEKLTATLRGIRSLTSHARSKASKLTQLIDQFESTQVDKHENLWWIRYSGDNNITIMMVDHSG